MQPARNWNMIPGSSSPQSEILEIIKIIFIFLFFVYQNVRNNFENIHYDAK